MKSSILSASLALAVLAASVASAQRIEFQRQKFDRSRFEHSSAAPAQPATAPASTTPSWSSTPSQPTYTSYSSSSPYSPSAPASSPAAAPVTTVYSSHPDADASPAPDSPYTSTGPSSYGPRPPRNDPATNAPVLWERIPTKPFTRGRDFEEVLALQKESNACILLYVRNLNETNQKGLCSWFEKATAAHRSFQKAARAYIQCEITLPGNRADQEVAQKYNVVKGPTLLVVPPTGFPQRIQLFTFDAQKKPTAVPVDTVVESIISHSPPAYQEHVPTLL